MRCRSKWIESHITSRCSPDSAHTVAVQSHPAQQTIGNRPWLFLSLAFSRIGNNVLRPAYRWAGWWFGVLFHEERQLPWKPKVREPYTNSTYLRRPPSRCTAVPPYPDFPICTAYHHNVTKCRQRGARGKAGRAQKKHRNPLAVRFPSAPRPRLSGPGPCLRLLVLTSRLRPSALGSNISGLPAPNPLPFSSPSSLGTEAHATLRFPEPTLPFRGAANHLLFGV